MNPAHELPGPAIPKCLTFAVTVRKKTRAEKTKEKQYARDLAALRAKYKKSHGYKTLSNRPEALCDEYGNKRKATKADVLDMLKDELGKSAIQAIVCPWQDNAYLSGVTEGIVDLDACDELSEASCSTPECHAAGIDGLVPVHNGSGAAQKTIGEFAAGVAANVLKYFKAGATCVVWAADRRSERSAVRDTVGDARAQASEVSLPEVMPATEDDFMLTGKRHQYALQVRPEYKANLLRAIAKKLLAMGPSIARTKREGALDPLLVLDIEYPGSAEHPVVVSDAPVPREIKERLECPHDKSEADYSLMLFTRRVREDKMLIVAGDTDLVIYASALHSLKAFGNKHVMIERQVKKSVGLTMRPEYIDIPRLCNALNEAEIWRDIPNPWILFTYVYILAGSDYVPAWAGAGHKTWFKHVKKHWRFVSTKQVPADDSASAATSEFPMQVELIPPHGSSGRLDVKLTFNNTAGLRIASLPYYQWSLAQLGKVPLETLWQQALTSPEKRDANLQERWNNHLFFGEVVPHGDDQAALEVIRRATHALPKGDEKKCLPSYDDLLGQCQRASYVLTLIFKSIVERNSQVKHLFSDYGWELTDDGKVRIKWGQVEPPPEATNRQGRSRSAAQRQQQQSTRCGCKPNKDGIYCTSGRCKCTQCGPTCPCSGGRCAKRQQTQQPAAEGCNQGQQGAALPQPEAAAETNGGMPCHNTELQVYVEEEQEAADKVAEEDAGSSDEDEDEDEDARSEDALLAAQHPPGDGDEDEDENNM